MKKVVLIFTLCVSMLVSCMIAPVTALADAALPEEKKVVVTMGANLTADQRAMMFKFFGVEEGKVEVLDVTNADERKFLEGVASEQAIGKYTYSCSCIEETEEGTGINVMIANLNWVTSYMISSALTTAGIYNCNVIAGAPTEVSGTGALTGIMMAYEKVTGEALDEAKKELATEELVVTGTIAEDIGTDAATGLITEVKDAVIADNVTDSDEIEEIITDESEKYKVELSDEQVAMIADTMVKVAEQKYDYEAIKGTFSNITSSAEENLGIVTEKVDEAKGFFGTIGNFFKEVGSAIGNFFKGIGNWFGGLFGKDDKKDKDDKDKEATDEITDSILNNTDTSILGDDVIVNSTDGESVTAAPDSESSKKPEDAGNDSSAAPNATDASSSVAPEATKKADSDTSSDTSSKPAEASATAKATDTAE